MCGNITLTPPLSPPLQGRGTDVASKWYISNKSGNTPTGAGNWCGRLENKRKRARPHGLAQSIKNLYNNTRRLYNTLPRNTSHGTLRATWMPFFLVFFACAPCIERGRPSRLKAGLLTTSHTDAPSRPRWNKGQWIACFSTIKGLTAARQSGNCAPFPINHSEKWTLAPAKLHIFCFSTNFLSLF